MGRGLKPGQNRRPSSKSWSCWRRLALAPALPTPSGAQGGPRGPERQVDGLAGPDRGRRKEGYEGNDPRQPFFLPSLTHQVNHPEKTRERKGKEKQLRHRQGSLSRPARPKVAASAPAPTAPLGRPRDQQVPPTGPRLLPFPRPLAPPPQGRGPRVGDYCVTPAH